MEQLHEHNQKTYENICRMYGEGIQRVAIVQPTGSGKSLLMAKLIEDNTNSRFFVLSTSHKINDQFKSKLDEETLKRIDFNIYCNMPNMKQEMIESLQPDYIFLDEMHRALAKEWSKGINVLLNMYPDAKVLGLSATPIRYLDKCRNVAEELFNGNLACDMSLSQAILDGILPMARYVCGVYSYEKDTESLNKKIEKSCNSEEEKKELLKELKILKENLDKGHGVSDIFKKYVVSGSEKFVVFLKDTTHLRIMKPVIEKWFTDAGFSVRTYEVHSKNADKDKEFQKFKEDTEDGIIKACLSVNMLAEGIHGDIDGVIMLRNTISANMYFQMIGRAFACGKKTIPLIIDLVANSQFISDAANLSFPNELRREIKKRKEECEKESKEYDPGFDVNEFIVMDEFMDVVSGFRTIEGRLEGSWDLYIKALKQYKEREGDCLVPKRHIEVVGGVNVKLGQWIGCMRAAKVGRINYLLTEERKYQLDQLGFIWDANKYYFENRVKEIANYYEEYNEYPTVYISDSNVKGMANFIYREKNSEKNGNYPEWKIKIIQHNFPHFFSGGKLDESFNKFIYYIKLYKQKNGHLNIKTSDIIDDYKIGKKLNSIKTKKEKLPESRVKQLAQLGLYLGDSMEKKFKEKMDLCKWAVDNSVIINSKNRFIGQTNIYCWLINTVKKKYIGGKLSYDEIEILEKMIDKPLNKFFDSHGGIFLKVVDILENNEIGIYRSVQKAIKEMKKMEIMIDDAAIYKQLSKKVTTPYKGRFVFYYATDEEVKKYLEDNKTN